MFKDKNFGLPKSLIDDVSNILKENRTASMRTPSAIGDKAAAYMPAREKKHKEEMGEKVGRFAQSELTSKLQGRLEKEKNPLAISGVTEALTDEKFINYLNENYHMEKLTLEEIQYIYERTWWEYLTGQPKKPTTDIVDDINRTNKASMPPLPGTMTRREPRKLTGMLARPIGGESAQAKLERSRKGDTRPQLPSGPSLASVTPSGDNPDEGMGSAPTLPSVKTPAPVAKAPAPVDKPTPAPVAKAPAPVSKPEPQDDWKSKVHSGGLGTAEGDTGSERPPSVSRRPSRPSRPSGGNGGDWKKSVYEPDGA